MSSSSPEFPCPSCGFIVFEEPIGCYEICPLCGWEDDPVQLATPGLRGGANGGSLKDYQDKALLLHPIGQNEVGGFLREPTWRPLSIAECIVEAPESGAGVAYFNAVCESNPKYYWAPGA